MVESGDWLVPRINGLPFVHKPPLYFWMEAALIKIFGLSSFVARLPSLCASILICACVYRLVRDFKGERAACWSVAVLVFSPLFYGGAQYADLDMLVASLITATITCALVATRCGPREPRKEQILWLAAYAAAGLGVLAKGLIGVVLPGSVFVLYVAISGQWSFLWRAISFPGLVLFTGIVVPWFVGMEHKLPGLRASFLRLSALYPLHHCRFQQPAWHLVLPGHPARLACCPGRSRRGDSGSSLCASDPQRQSRGSSAHLAIGDGGVLLDPRVEGSGVHFPGAASFRNSRRSLDG